MGANLPRFVSRSRVLLPPPPELRQRVVVLGRPRIKHLDRLDEEPAHGRQGVFDHRRDKRINLSNGKAVPVPLPQRFREHLLSASPLAPASSAGQAHSTSALARI